MADKPGDELLHVTFELVRAGGALRSPDNALDDNVISDVRFVDVDQLTDYGFSATWRDLALSGFAEAPRYVGLKEGIGI